MKVTSIVLFVLVILTVNEGGHALVKQLKNTVNQVGGLGKKLNSEVLAKAVEFFCENSGKLGDFALKGCGFLKCDQAHQGQDYCKFVDDGKMVYDMICCLAEEQRKEAFDMAFKCFQTKDKNDGQDCLQRWFKWISSLKEVAEIIGQQAGGR